MTWDFVLTAFAITTLGVAFGAVPMHCLVGTSGLFGRLDRRAPYGRRVVAHCSPSMALRDDVENDCVVRFPVRRVPVIERPGLTEARVDQLAS